MKINLHKHISANSFCFVFLSFFVFNTGKAQLVAVTGTYIGTGNINLTISGLGFRPDILLVNSGQYHAQITTTTFPINLTKDLNGGDAQPGLVTSLDLDGFSLGTDNAVNKVGTAYNFLALKTETGAVETGSYIGNNIDNRNITGTSFQPEMVIIIPQTNTKKPVYSSITMGADQSMNFLNSGFVSNRIQAFNANGFQVGKNKDVNELGVIYHFIALRSVPGKIFIGSYFGDGTNNRVIPVSGVGSFVMVKKSGDNAIHRNRDMPVNNSYYFKNSASVSNRIKRNTSAGFELGDDNDVNQAGKEYHYLKLIGLNSILPVQLLSFDAKLFQGKVQIEWKTGPSDNVGTFEIERSKDLVNFELLTKIPGVYNNSSAENYQYTDNDPSKGYSYYRLKITDQSGRIHYSETKKIIISENNPDPVIFYPNPLKGNVLNIRSTGSQTTIYIDITDYNGKKVKSTVLQSGTGAVTLGGHLPAGIYYLVGNDGRSVLFIKRLVKL